MLLYNYIISALYKFYILENRQIFRGGNNILRKIKRAATPV